MRQLQMTFDHHNARIDNATDAKCCERHIGLLMCIRETLKSDKMAQWVVAPGQQDHQVWRGEESFLLSTELVDNDGVADEHFRHFCGKQFCFRE